MSTKNKNTKENTLQPHIIENSSEELNDDTNNDQSIEFEQQCEFVLKKLTDNYREQREEIRNLIKLHNKDMKTISKTKHKKNNHPKKDKSGFTKPSVIPDKLATFVGIKKGSVMSRTELTGLICNEFKKRNLYYEHDKRVIIPDEDVKKLFNLSDNAVKSTNPKDKDGLNFYNLQKYIAECYNEYNNTVIHKKTNLNLNKKT